MHEQCHTRLSQLSSAAHDAYRTARAVDGALPIYAGTTRRILTMRQREVIELLAEAEDELAAYRRDRYDARIERTAALILVAG